MLTVSRHAIERFKDRIANVSDDEARAILSSPAIQLAAAFMAAAPGKQCFVRFGTGHRAAIVDSTVVTVLPATYRRKQIRRTGLGRFGCANGGWGNEE